MRVALTLNLELGGRRAAFARVELLDGTGDAQVARVALSGRIDRAAERRLERALSELAPRRVSRVVLDCSAVSGMGAGQVNRLVEALARFERPPGPVDVYGLPSSLRERLAGRRRRCPDRRAAETESSPSGDSAA